MLEIYIDGASQGNPGLAGIGVIIYKDNLILKNISRFIGIATNNVAEYTALIYALQEALILRAKDLKINSDSQLLVRQLNGEYRVKDADLISLYEQVKHLLSGFKHVKIVNIPREDNKGADALAANAIKKRPLAVNKQVKIKQPEVQDLFGKKLF